MEPRPFERGNGLGLGLGLGLREASMEPRPFERGNAPQDAPLQRHHLASMERRPFERGNPRYGRRRHTEYTGFNGATSFRTWKHSCATSEPRCTVALQWSHVLSNVETQRARHDHVLIGNASMEPRPFER